ncbi:MAG: fibrobacter succinogenes major paralogous domain-containing protein [Chitinispirillales bacterium]|nr:fibrobacter succinogenes major paralogous domain-containing protein [Chitinispirillales bacterium]
MGRKFRIMTLSAAILSLFCLSVYAQVGMAGRSGSSRGGDAVAAYVFGAETSANAEALAEAVVDNLVRSRNYSAPRRGAREFFREADRAQARNRNRLLEDRDFCRIGSDFGVQYLCIVDIERAGRGNSVWARVIDLGNCRVIATAEYTGLIRNTREIQTAANSLTDELLRRRIGSRSTGAGIGVAPAQQSSHNDGRSRQGQAAVGVGQGQTASTPNRPTTPPSAQASTPTPVQAPTPASVPEPTPTATPAAPVATPPPPSAEDRLRGDRDAMFERLDAQLAQQAGGGGGSGTFTDSRDAQTYRVVRIGDLMWMAQNLNYMAVNMSCYDNDPSNCAKYGFLYTWDAAMTACPAGWRLPTCEDWANLTQAAGGEGVAGSRLRSTTDWVPFEDGFILGTDGFGFSALPGGYLGIDGAFWNVGAYGSWWSATANDASRAWQRTMLSNDNGVYRYDWDKNSGLSVRCVR